MMRCWCLSVGKVVRVLDYTTQNNSRVRQILSSYHVAASKNKLQRLKIGGNYGFIKFER